MTVRSLVYVANVRLPTENAHGHGIVRICEAFAELGVDVELWHPRRHQPDAALRDVSIFDFYGISPSFRVRSLRNIDVVRLSKYVPDTVFRFIFVAHEIAWGAIATCYAIARGAGLYVTRDVLVAWWLARWGLPTVLDVHYVPAGLRRHVIVRLPKLPGFRAMIAVTNGNRERLMDLGVPPEEIVVAGNGVDIHRFDSVPDRTTCRIMRKLPVDRPIIGYVGRFRALGNEKGIEELIRAVALLKAKVRPSPFLLCVGGPMDGVPTYLALARDIGLSEEDICFKDHVPATEVPEWINCLDVGTLLYPPTDYGAHFTSPLKAFEYMAAGISIVASDVPSMHEALGSFSRASFVRPGDTAGAAAAIEEFIRTKEDALGIPHVSLPTWRDRARAILAGIE